jgi:signal transduction histidine kinase
LLTTQAQLNLLVGIVSLIISLVLFYISVRKVYKATYASLRVFSIALALYSVSYNLFTLEIFPGRLFWLSCTLLGLMALPVGMLLFSFEYTQQNHRITRRLVIILFIIPGLFQLGLWTNRWHGLFLHDSGDLIAHFWFHLNILYSNVLLAITIFLLIQKSRHRAPQHRNRYRLLLLGVGIPFGTSALIFGGVLALSSTLLMMLAYSLNGVVIVIGIFHSHLFRVYPIERDFAIEAMSDGWLILDMQNKVIDVNRAAEVTLGIPRKRIINEHASKVLTNWDNILRNLSAKDLELRGSIKIGDDWRYYSMNLSRLVNTYGNESGKLIIWKDITDQRKAADARQRARDEMFILLQSITGASNRMLETDDFMLEAIYQIVSVFQIKSTGIFLLQEKKRNQEEPDFSLIAEYGFSEDLKQKLLSVLNTVALKTLFQNKYEPLQFMNLESFLGMEEMEMSEPPLCMLVAPLTFEGRFIGVMLLTRDEEDHFAQDEISRMEVVINEMANFIQSDRRRQVQIAMRERKKLLQDLHDALSQSLFGLLVMAEAAQEGMKHGTPVTERTLRKISENARQALREMRLFLHELQPVNLEREGLENVLRNRLTSVEGRSGLKARFLSKGDLSLSPNKELALYYIAQEALNNILRHAQAKTVELNLIKKRVNVTLDIVDDGIGFDKQEDKGGMGLQNMHERVKQIDGRLKIDTGPGKGTKITVTVRDDRKHPRPKKKRTRNKK